MMNYVLGIETSCDDTAVAVMRSDLTILSNVLSSQNTFHAKYGGIVPEIASRKHLELISFVVKEALDKARITLDEASLLAVTHGPGLVGSLLIGVDYVKAISVATGKPFVGVNHLEGHLLSPLLEHPEIDFPYLGIIVSGGHTLFVIVTDFGKYRKVAETIDDACGEALDKFGKLLSIPYPAGPIIERLATGGDPKKYPFTMPNIRDNLYGLSFSGFKTAASQIIKNIPLEDLSEKTPDLCASYQDILFRQILRMTKRILEKHRVTSVAVSGGVSANQTMFEMFSSKLEIPVYFPSKILSTDNAGMIAFAGYRKFIRHGSDPLDMPVLSRLDIG
jgi:N6-L-threonylcarbamoyladenine synthase